MAMKKRIPRAKKHDAEKCQCIKECISNDVSVSLRVLKTNFQEKNKIVVSITIINTALKEIYYSFKRIALIPEAWNTIAIVIKKKGLFRGIYVTR